MKKSACITRFQFCLQPSIKVGGIKPIKIKMKLKANEDRPFHDILFVSASYGNTNVQSFIKCITSLQDGQLKG